MALTTCTLRLKPSLSPLQYLIFAQVSPTPFLESIIILTSQAALAVLISAVVTEDSTQFSCFCTLYNTKEMRKLCTCAFVCHS